MAPNRRNLVSKSSFDYPVRFFADTTGERMQVPSPRSSGSESVLDLAKLRDAAAVRERCHMVYRWVAEGRSPHFTLDEDRLGTVAAYVADVTRDAYPDLKIPYHSRWRHFSAGGIDRWSSLAARIDTDPIARARTAVDLATVSVLLDAGAGDAWRYREPDTGKLFARSEGLGVASFDMFRAGAFSADPEQPYRVDHVALERIDAAMLARPEIPWSGWSNAARCCAVSARRLTSARTCSAARPRAPATWPIIF
jgi:hypothetical protein